MDIAQPQSRLEKKEFNSQIVEQDRRLEEKIGILQKQILALEGEKSSFYSNFEIKKKEWMCIQEKLFKEN